MSQRSQRSQTRKMGWRCAAVVFAMSCVVDVLVPRPAHAIVGRPLTPMSYAGVARRTTRRTVVAAPVVAPVARRAVVW